MTPQDTLISLSNLLTWLGMPKLAVEVSKGRANPVVALHIISLTAPSMKPEEKAEFDRLMDMFQPIEPEVRA